MRNPTPPLLLPQLFERAAARYATKVALRAADGPVTYGELDARSRRFAGELVSRGIGPESLVGVAVGRRSALLVGLLGIVRAGAAYLPLDPTHPADRLRYMLEDSAAALLVADDPELCTRLGARDLPTISPAAGQDRPATAWGAGGPAGNRDSEGTLAYVIYTSGSTGRPKGVEIPHGALANLLASMQATPGLSADDRVLAITTLSFDIAVVELWLPLVTGATVVLVDRDVAMDGARLGSVIRDERITVVQATPTTWSMLLAAGWREGRGITALSGGEPLPRDLATAIQRTGADLWNMYGPTETTVWSTHWHVAEGPIAIGGPVANTTLHVLDDGMQPVAAGATGELYIGGTGVARGYRHRPDLTAERFLADPFGDTPGARLYRTGDLARMRPDGVLECLGRVDNQVKVDGYRIEPGEIEAVLRTAPAVRDAVVAAVEVAGQDLRLVAYVSGDERGCGPADLRALAARHLPAYMVPAGFVHLGALPLTSSGKIDRRALPPPDFSRPAGLDYVPPSTATERALAEMWREILGLERIGIHDNFFEIGGRSRLGASLFAAIAERFGRVLPLATLFEAPTIATLAERLDSARADERGWSSLVPIQQGSAAIRPFFCMHPVGGHVVSYRELVQRLGPEIPFYGLQSAGLDGRTPPVASIEAMADRYLQEIRRVQPTGPYRLGGASFGGLVAYEMARRIHAAGDEVALLAMLDTEFPPLARLSPVRQLAGRRFLKSRVYPGLRRVLSQGAAFQQMGPAAYLAYVRRRLWPAAGAPDPRDEEERDDRPRGGSDAFTRAVHRVVAENYRAMANYIPQPYDGVITYLRARDAEFALDLRHLWTTVARRVDVHEVPGTHFGIRREPQVQVLASILREYLLRSAERDEASPPGPSRQPRPSARATA